MLEMKKEMLESQVIADDWERVKSFIDNGIRDGNIISALHILQIKTTTLLMHFTKH